MLACQRVSALAIAVFFALAGPAKSQDEVSQNTAVFIFVKSYDVGVGFGTGTLQQYFYLPNGICRGKRRVANFSWVTGSQVQRSLPADRPLTLWMVTRHYRGLDQYVCQNALRFTPRAGATYNVALTSFVTDSCRISITDQSNGQAPEDIFYDNSIRCT
jgi:hypothetical protein